MDYAFKNNPNIMAMYQGHIIFPSILYNAKNYFG